MTVAVGASALLGVSIDHPSDVFDVGHPSAVPSPNWGLKFLNFTSTTGGAEYGAIAVPELGAGIGTPRSAPGDIGVSMVVNRPSRAGALVPTLTAMYGAPTKTSYTRPVPSALTATLASPAAPGNVDNGEHTYAVTFVNASGETTIGATATATVADKGVNGQVALTNIPIGLTGTTARKVYRSEAGTTTPLKLLTTIANNTATTYTDNTADSALGAAAPSTNTALDGSYKYAWDVLSAADIDPRSLTMLEYKGSPDVTPEWFYGLFGTSFQWTVAAGALAQEQATFVGQHHGLSAVSTVVAGGSGYAGAVVARGVRADSTPTLPLFVKITSAPSLGVFKVKTEVKASSPTYPGAEYTLYYNTVSKYQTKTGSTQMSDWWEVLDSSGDKLGADTCSNRAPYEILFTGDVTGLQLNDEFKIEPSCLIPGAGSSPYSGTAPSYVTGCRFTSAHCTITLNGSPVMVHNATCALAVPREPYRALGPEARFALDMNLNGYATGQLQIQRRFDSRTYEAMRFGDIHIAGIFQLEGSEISDTGRRQTAKVTFNQMGVQNTDSNLNSVNWVPESVTLVAEQPDNGSTDFANIEIITDADWTIS